MRIITGLLVILYANTSLCQLTISTHDELRQYNDLSLLPSYRTGTSLHQISSYDREGKNDDGFSGKYSFIRRNADSSLVMFEAAGPGVINRIWTPTPTEDTLDFFVDDTVFSIKYRDLFWGKLPPFTPPLCGNALGGFYCYYPILFNDSCRIVSRGRTLQFHQVQWRKYPAGTKVKRSFERFTLSPPGGADDINMQVTVQANSSSLLFQKGNGGRINAFKIYPASAFKGNRKQVWLKIVYDDEGIPAVYAPASDFFGFAFGEPSMRSHVIGVNNDTAYCYLPMPFDKSFSLELENRGTTSLSFDVFINESDQKRNVASEGKLYTSYNHRKYGKHDGPHELLHTQGRGHYIGTILQCQGTVPGMTLFFEGDDSTMVDGKLALHGTGSEDYFNGGWYAFPDRWDDAQSLPFHGSLEYNLPVCRTGAYRFYFSDKIPFQHTLHHSIEHGPVNNNIPAIYTSIAFYYGDKGVGLRVTRDTDVFMPDTLMLYPQLTDVNVWNAANIKSAWAHDTGGMSYIYTVTNETMLLYSLDEIPEGNYNVYMDFDRLPAGADLRFSQRQSIVKDWFTTSGDSSRVERFAIGSITKNTFLKTISVELKTTADRNQFFLNRFILVRRP